MPRFPTGSESVYRLSEQGKHWLALARFHGYASDDTLDNSDESERAAHTTEELETEAVYVIHTELALARKTSMSG